MLNKSNNKIEEGQQCILNAQFRQKVVRISNENITML